MAGRTEASDFEPRSAEARNACDFTVRRRDEAAPGPLSAHAGVGWHYDRAAATKDGLAALIVTLMLIPQSLAYAMLAGLPPVTGLYASMLPLIAYTLFGTSRTWRSAR